MSWKQWTLSSSVVTANNVGKPGDRAGCKPFGTLRSAGRRVHSPTPSTGRPGGVSV
jgi:hypothetical protein